ncbi:flagellar basal body-associated protein FliL [Motilimonas pumila]|uniref:Flagellar protein FliL n=1 Tax=Motilimonas pumila TaxID=2303987 RepID=A0A418YGP1_9GAMM|nr:flagellar basal body-associated protein FliL [Motilimonas pumila]RJG49028.1 flagellar basal body-associated protein FliL [Motilimonas pumila]
MADEATEDLALNEKKPGKGKLIIIIVAVLVLLAGGGGAAHFLMGGEDTDETSAPASEGDSSASTGKTSNLQAIYVGMPRPFVFNVTAMTGERERLVQIKVQLMVRGTNNENTAKQHIPLIEGTLLSVFSAATAQELRSEEGKKELRKKSLQEVQKAMNEVASAPTVESVLFTGFVLQ